jgi:hypothetical protein
MQTIVNRDWPQVPSTPKISGVERFSTRFILDNSTLENARWAEITYFRSLIYPIYFIFFNLLNQKK